MSSDDIQRVRGKKEAVRILRGEPDKGIEPRPVIYRDTRLDPPSEGRLTWAEGHALIDERCPPATRTGRPSKLDDEVNVSVRFERTTIEAIDKARDGTGRSRSDEIRDAVREKFGR